MSGSISNWKGFTVEDIKSHAQGKIEKSALKKMPKTAKTQHSVEKCFPVPTEAKLSPTNESSPEESLTGSSKDNSTNTSSHLPGNRPKNVTILVAEDKSYEVVSAPLKTDDDPMVNDEGDHSDQNGHACLLLEKSSLDKFEERQRLMEEQNKKRKDLLTKALADRKKQTQSETKKLLQIQEELSRLDALLSNDVALLRDQIEIASHEFNEAQKHYDHMESLFVDAKVKLFNKMERKQMLTEHLCRIIEANELRKARKLSELMTRLEITQEEKEQESFAYQGNDIFLERPCSLDEVAYAVCTTLKNPPKSNTPLPTLLKEAEVSDNG